jgi:hypothetical protein
MLLLEAFSVLKAMMLFGVLLLAAQLLSPILLPCTVMGAAMLLLSAICFAFYYLFDSAKCYTTGLFYGTGLTFFHVWQYRFWYILYRVVALVNLSGYLKIFNKG